MLCAEGTIFCHIPAGLTHEPDRRAINRLTPAGFQKAIIYHFGILETRGECVNSHWAVAVDVHCGVEYVSVVGITSCSARKRSGTCSKSSG